MKYIIRYFALWVVGCLVLALIFTLVPFPISNVVITITSILWLLVCFVISFVLYMQRPSEGTE